MITDCYGDPACLLNGRLVLEPNGKINVEKTNHKLVMNSRTLDNFKKISANDKRILFLRPALSEIDRPPAVALLCAGISTRSNGFIHPLFELEPGKTLLDIQLDRLASAGIPSDLTFIHCSPKNKASIEASYSRYQVYEGTWSKRLTQIQGHSLSFENDLPGNPGGHYDALRSFPLDQLLNLDRHSLLLVMSVTNVGMVVDHQIGRYAAKVMQIFARHPAALAIVETTSRPADKPTGSFVTEDDNGLYLIKPNYGLGALRQDASRVLMSTNTWWFNLERLRQRLSTKTKNNVKAFEQHRGLTHRSIDHRDSSPEPPTTSLFDNAFPIFPHLKEKKLNEKTFIQAERDLDQLSIYAPNTIVPIKVNENRGYSVKSVAAISEWWQNQ